MKEKLSRKAWQRAINALLWYPDNKAEYNALPGDTQDGAFDPTGKAAVELAESMRYQTIKQEITAVEAALEHLHEDQRVVIERRFFSVPKGEGVYRKPRQYDFLQDIGFSERAMRRISRKAVVYVAYFLGEK